MHNIEKITLRIIWFIVFMQLSIFYSCDKNNIKPKEVEKLGLIKISYKVKTISELVPSYQTVIWLEDNSGQFIKSLFVSEWLAYVGYKYDEICPTWKKLANWMTVSDSVFDVVTSATPQVGPNTMIIDCEQEQLTAGIISVNIETHIVENYNVLHSAEIELGAEPVSIQPKVTYIPEKHAQAGDVLTDIQIEYYFRE